CRTCLSQKERLQILDIGTGSGCIAIALARFLKRACIVSLDKSGDALALACENARLTETEQQIEFQQVDFSSLDKNIFGRTFDVVVSNPPYVSRTDFETLAPEIKEFEPAGAISDCTDGLTFFRRISQITPVLLNNPGWVFVEVSFGQAKDVEKIFLEAGGRELKITKDLSNIERVVGVRMDPT
ncbi:MAG: N5-glutamine methyltransferase family protein, partial [Candidatus Kryptoniota bacterium]